MAGNLKRLFLGASIPSVASSALNLVATTLTVRWFGAEVYADYIVDLAIVSVLMVLLEIVPSNYSVFKLQDDFSWRECVAAQIVASMLFAASLIVIVGESSPLFHRYSAWMSVYAVALAAKRYLDIRLQAAGRLSEFMLVELVNSMTRVLLLTGFSAIGVEASASVWGSLAIALVFSQCVWWSRNKSELQVLMFAFDPAAWGRIVSHFRNYIPYYYGILLKRLKDNCIPVAAESVFVSKHALAAFFLAYRGVIFSAGQIRIFEALLNHRATLAKVAALSRGRKAVIALLSQCVCVGVSAVLLIASHVDYIPWIQLFVISFTIWPIAYQVVERSRAYSNFRAGVVNAGMLAYLVVAAAGSGLLLVLGDATGTAFSLVLIAGECVVLMILTRENRKHDIRQA